MSSRAGSTFVTFLMSVPLAAVGLMAVFGVPPLSSVIAATRGLNETDRGSKDTDASNSNSREDQFKNWDSGTAPEWNSDGATPDEDQLGDVEDISSSKPSRRTGEPGTTGSRRGGLSSTLDLKHGDSDPTQPGSRSPRPGRGDSRIGLNESDEEPVSRPPAMKDSLKKLNALGVKHYHLERGTDQDTWLFVCLFCPSDESRVTHRFEAESDDPDRAAEETVKQLDGWLLKRFRDKQPITQNAM